TGFLISYMKPLRRSVNDRGGELPVDYPLRFSIGLQQQSFYNFNNPGRTFALRPVVQISIFLISFFLTAGAHEDLLCQRLSAEQGCPQRIRISRGARTAGRSSGQPPDPGGRIFRNGSGDGRVRRGALLGGEPAEQSLGAAPLHSQLQAGCCLVQPCVFELWQQAASAGSFFRSYAAGAHAHGRLLHARDTPPPDGPY